MAACRSQHSTSCMAKGSGCGAAHAPGMLTHHQACVHQQRRMLTHQPGGKGTTQMLGFCGGACNSRARHAGPQMGRLWQCLQASCRLGGVVPEQSCSLRRSCWCRTATEEERRGALLHVCLQQTPPSAPLQCLEDLTQSQCQG